MKKIYFILLLSLLVCVGCQFKWTDDNKSDDQLIKIERFDRLEYRYLTVGDYSALQQMSTEFPFETRTLIEKVLKIGQITDPDINSKFLKFYQDTTLQTIISSVQSKYSNINDIQKELSIAFARLEQQIPNLQIPKVYTQISALDQSIVAGDGKIGISLDKYLGEDYPIYNKYYIKQQRKQMTRDNIIPDCLMFYLMSLYPLRNYDFRPQFERDIHMAKIQWVANKAMSNNYYKGKYVDMVSKFMKINPNIKFEELLESTDFSGFANLD
ncbi:hypothetical protein [Prevotella bivia]|uniref:gliding motility protein GldB-related protein n=1 Tax=Prevotella bivia TaxID=28125 RepID=UPI00254A67FE|nr:hypothetical protein [Prevotella bivia]MDZ3818269.1 hypothetical protein [Prevotella bivia]WIL19151.1 hypothetical protein QP022_08025 [Prevotella bivia]